MDSQVQTLALVVVVAAVYALARRIGALPPLLLVLVGLVASVVPGIPDYTLDPELVLTFFLPPLLYAASVQTSLPSLRDNARSIGLLAVGLVLFTALVVAVVAHAMVDGLPWGAAVALGAIVAPPDAVAATAVARRTGLPRRVVTLLEGESLVNDATALTTLRVAVASIAASSPSWGSAVGQLLVAAAGGVAVGVVTAKVVAFLRKRVDDPVMDSVISLLTPFAAFAASESWSSGVLAVVVAGILLGHKAPLIQSPQSRLQQAGIWSTIEFILQGVVFALVGLQLKSVVQGLEDDDLGHALLVSLAVSAAVVVSRPLWIFPATYLPRRIPSVRRHDPPPEWKVPAVISWAGMRGAVSLAAALSLDETVPHRRTLVLVTFVVIGVTLLLQGATLPWVIRRLGLHAPDPVADTLQEASVKQRASRAAESVLDELAARNPLPDGVEDRLRDGVRHRALSAWERLGSGPGGSANGPAPTETPSAAFARVRKAMLDAERAVLVQARDAGRLEHDVLQRLQRDLDLEETMLTRDDGD
ncbi:CPA1 family monovalent cation:H+ antiporter [Motilibacter peucedani]|uniref:CPA1 family monovalent cation:H+ antiporter n=1 Tax=Motilibacter peucedani TaxID=598650 RepID=A0A420XM85_9ACTN|nr:Na+/H+ antiporter [Motilibacter peucedani]RKS71350.1 CPA1 family monovalent cation:H+ antiporter [Motilibacter peucedani]